MKNNAAPAKKIVMVIIAIITWAALVLQFSLTIKTTDVTGFSNIKTITNFFSYFTILSNILVAVSLTVSLLNPASRTGTFFLKTSVQSSIAVYIFIVGLVYNLVLRNIWSPKGWQLVADNLLHVAVPVLFVLYWIIFTAKNILQWKNILPWLIFPMIYLIYSLLRGPVADWYPYPFLHAGQLGYGKVSINSLFVLMAFLLVGLGMVAFNRAGKKRQIDIES